VGNQEKYTTHASLQGWLEKKAIIWVSVFVLGIIEPALLVKQGITVKLPLGKIMGQMPLC